MRYLILFILSWLGVEQLIGQPIITRKSYVEFSIGTIAFGKVTGTLGYIEGEINFQENDLANSFFKVSVPANSILTDNENRDKHLINEDFLDVNLFPKISFESTSFSQNGKKYFVEGMLTIRDVSKPVTIEFSVNNENLFKEFEGNLSIERLDYDVGIGQKNALVKSTISIKIYCAIVKL